MLYGLPSKSGGEVSGTINPTTGDAEESLDFVSSLDEYYNQLTEEQKEALNDMDPNGDYLTSHKTHHAEEQNRFKEESEEFLMVLTNVEVMLTNMTDAELEEMVISSKFAYPTDAGIRDVETRHHEVSAFRDEVVRARSWDGWCGPAAFAMLYAGLERTYKGVDLYKGVNPKYKGTNPAREDRACYEFNRFKFITGDSGFDDQTHLLPTVQQESLDQDGGLYYDLSIELKTYSGNANGRFDYAGASWPWDFGKAMSRVSGRKYDAKSRFTWTGLTKDMYYQDMPGYSTRLLDVGGGFSSGGGHIRAIIGSSYKIKEVFTVFKWMCKLEFRGLFDWKAHWCEDKHVFFKYTDHHRILVFDNGSDTGRYGHHKPYWENTGLFDGGIHNYIFATKGMIVRNPNYAEVPERARVVINGGNERVMGHDLYVYADNSSMGTQAAPITQKIYDNDLDDFITFGNDTRSQKVAFRIHTLPKIGTATFYDRRDKYWGGLVGDEVIIHTISTDGEWTELSYIIRESDYDVVNKSATIDLGIREVAFNWNGYNYFPHQMIIIPRSDKTLGHSSNLANLNELINTTNNIYGRAMPNTFAISELVIMGEANHDHNLASSGRSVDSTMADLGGLSDGDKSKFFTTTDRVHAGYSSDKDGNYVEVKLDIPRSIRMIRIYDKVRGVDNDWGTLVNHKIYINDKYIGQIQAQDYHVPDIGEVPFVQIPVEEYSVSSIRLVGQEGVHYKNKNTSLDISRSDRVTLSEIDLIKEWR